MNRIEIKENGIYMVMEIGEDKEVKLLHFSHIPFQEETISREYERHGFRLVELSLSGYDRPEERHGIKHTVTSPGYRLKYDSHKDYVNEQGRKLEIVTFDEETKVYVTSHFQFFQGISVVRTWSVVENRGEEPQGLEYISTFNLNGLSKEGILPRDEKMKISVVHNSWQRELQWEEYTLPQLGLAHSQPDGWDRSSKAFQVTNTGNWSTKEYIPMGRVTNQETGTSLFWQIEHNGSWHWEISDQTGHLYLQLSGPSENESHWFQWLKPGESFTSVPAGVGVSGSKPEDMMEQLTLYRRRIRRPNKDNEQLAVIFNDYMNCLWADPTTEKEFPLIDAAAEIGCEYFCIDAGWYADGYWWDAVGEWLPSHKRFPGGIQEVISYIRKKGMIPGLWLELEVMGIHCPKVKELPKEAFFQRHGKKVYDRSRYQLDFRHPQVIAHVNEVIDRLVQEYGVGYIKMDYNIEPGIGTEVQADSFGAGLLAHERAYLEWLDSVFQKYPDLIIENCSSGGLRMDYAMLSRYSIQSTSDQEDYLHYATIAANAPLAVAMEQAAIWSYPRMEGDREETVFNMVNAMLLRVHQSGHMADISPDRRALVKEGLDYYKEIRQDIRQAVPFWPLGFSDFASPWSALGLRAGKKNYLAVWRRGGEETQTLPVSHLACENCTIRIAYPKDSQGECAWNKDNGTISVRMPKSPMACIIEIIS